MCRARLAGRANFSLELSSRTNVCAHWTDAERLERLVVATVIKLGAHEPLFVRLVGVGVQVAAARPRRRRPRRAKCAQIETLATSERHASQLAVAVDTEARARRRALVSALGGGAAGVRDGATAAGHKRHLDAPAAATAARRCGALQLKGVAVAHRGAQPRCVAHGKDTQLVRPAGRHVGPRSAETAVDAHTDDACAAAEAQLDSIAEHEQMGSGCAMASGCTAPCDTGAQPRCDGREEGALEAREGEGRLGDSSERPPSPVR